VVDLLDTGCPNSWRQWRLRRWWTRAVHCSTGGLKLVAKSFAVTVGVSVAFTLAVTVGVSLALTVGVTIGVNLPVTLAITVADTMPEPDAQTYANPVSITL
jgi:uncharacterized protein (DUF2062 family)